MKQLYLNKWIVIINEPLYIVSYLSALEKRDWVKILLAIFYQWVQTQGMKSREKRIEIENKYGEQWLEES